jgi:hypothetical protein
MARLAKGRGPVAVAQKRRGKWAGRRPRLRRLGRKLEMGPNSKRNSFQICTRRFRMDFDTRISPKIF